MVRSRRCSTFVAIVALTGACLASPCAPATADIGIADAYLDSLTAGAATPNLAWTDCADGFSCATAEVPMNYHQPHGDQIDLAVIKLPASDPSRRIGTLFINFGGPGNSGVDRLRQRATWPWLFSDELRSRFDLVSWDQRGVARSAAVRCFPDNADQWSYLVPINTRQGVPAGTAAAFDEFLDDCAAAGPRCAFAEGDPRTKWAAMTAPSQTSPVSVFGHPWTLPEIAASTLAVPDSYPQLAELLQQFAETDTATPELVADVTGTDPSPTDVDASYLSNREEAYNAIQCSDSTVPTAAADYRRASTAAAADSPEFGRISVFDTIPCAFWRGHDADRYTGPWDRHTSAPILVLNTRNDPATPLAGAYAGAAELYDARVVVTKGAGHTSMYVASTCTEQVKRDYLFTGVLPPVGTSCSRERSPFDG